MRFLRTTLVAAVVLLSGAALPAPAKAGPDVLIDISIFYDELDDGGVWFRHPRYGYVWSPDVDRDWRPYTRGRWIYTDDYGWFWDSEEPFGWAVYHYGRWGYDEIDGWYWVPGRRWGPAWVAWRYGDEYAGWAPLPPDAVWSPELGIVYNDDFHVSVRFDPFWIFVRPRYITYYNPYRFARPRHRYRHIFRYTRPAAGIAFINGRIFFRGIGPRQYRRIARRSLKRTPIKFFHDSRPYKYKRGAWSKRKSVRVYRPGKKRRYGAKRLKAPRIIYKTSPRRRAWKKRGGKRPAASKARTEKNNSWPAKGGRGKARTQRNEAPKSGNKRRSKSAVRRRDGSANEEEIRDTNTEKRTRPAAKAKRRSSSQREGVKERGRKRNVKTDRKEKPKREAKRVRKFGDTNDGKRGGKKKAKGKGERKGDEKKTAKNRGKN